MQSIIVAGKRTNALRMALACVVMSGCHARDDLTYDSGVVDLAVAVDEGMPPPPDDENPALTFGTSFSMGGYVSAYTWSGPPGFLLGARFFSGAPSAELRQTQVGPCTVYQGISPPGDGGFLDPSMAGSMHLIIGDEDYSIAESISDGGVAAGVRGYHALWQGGELLTFSGSGGELPAWTTTLTAPTSVVWLTPAVDQDTIPFSATKDNILTWTPGHGYILIAFGDPTTYAPNLPFGYCSFPANTGTAVLPAAAVTAMVNHGLTLGYVNTESARLVTAGPWTFSVEASVGIAFATIR